MPLNGESSQGQEWSDSSTRLVKNGGPNALADGIACPVTAVCLLLEPDLACSFVCAGIGPTLRVYRISSETFLPTSSERPEPIIDACVLPVAIHGISPACLESTRKSLVVYGQRYVAVSIPVVDAAEVCPSVSGRRKRFVRSLRAFPEWVLQAKYFSDVGAVVVGLAQGAIHVVDPGNLSTRVTIAGSGMEMFWSLALHLSQPPDNLNGCSFRVVAGTSFGELVIWSLPASLESGQDAGFVAEAEHARISAHDGPVMRIVHSDDAHGRWLASASVDRSVRVWKWTPSESEGYVPCATFYGHTARVWQVAFCRSPGHDREFGVPPRVFSVGEDKTMRLWPRLETLDCEAAGGGGVQVGKDTNCGNHTRHPPNVYSGHAGRNIWCLDVAPETSTGPGGAIDHGLCETGGSGKIFVATGGGDGLVQLRAVDCEGASSTPKRAGDDAISPGSSRPRRSDGVDAEFPPLETRPGVAPESVQAIVVREPSTLYASTSYGRLLCAHVAVDGLVDSWDVVYGASCDEDGVVFAPSALAMHRNLLFAGSTNGHVVVVDVDCGVSSSFLAIHSEARLICGIFVSSDAGVADEAVVGCVDIFISTLGGCLLHWRVDPACLESPALPAKRLCCYVESKPVRHAQVTSVLVLPMSIGILVGDRRGYLNMYRKKEEGEDGECDEGCPPICHPVAHCRPHKDRLSCITVTSLPRRTSPSLRNSGEYRSDTIAVATAGFDGRLTEIHVEVVTENGGVGSKRYSLIVASSLRCAERLETLVHVSCCRPLSGQVEGSLRACSPVVAGFRSAQLVVWDVLQRNTVLRADVGGWRRALGLHIEAKDVAGGSGSLPKPWVVAFWRSRVFRIVAAMPSDIASLGIGFHGLRAHDVAAVSDGTGSATILSASEDTTVRVTRVVSSGWEGKQVLSGHVSGANCIAALKVPGAHGVALALSGGGMDELILWKRPGETATWVRACVHSAPFSKDRRAARHRVMSVAVQSVGEPRHGLQLPGVGGEIRVVARALVGRSDGSVALCAVCEECRTGEVSVVDSDINRDIHSGAILSAAWDASGEFAVSGDSSGKIVMWRVAKNMSECGGSECLEAIGQEHGAHSAGVNGLSCAPASRMDGRAGWTDAGAMVVVSAGDDEAVLARPVSAAGRFGPPSLAARFGAAAIAVELVGSEEFVAVGADQAVVRGRVDGASPVCRRAAAIADPGGLAVLRVSQPPGAEDGAGGSGGGGRRVQVAVVGAGMEVLTV